MSRELLRPPLYCLIFVALIASISLRHLYITVEAKPKIIVEDSFTGNIRLKSPAIPPQRVDGSLLGDSGKNPDITDANSEADLYIGKKLDADNHYSASRRETLIINIGEPLSADSQLTIYTYETPLNLGENMDASNPTYPLLEHQSEYQNIGNAIAVEEENHWHDGAHKNIGPVLAVDMDVL